MTGWLVIYDDGPDHKWCRTPQEVWDACRGGRLCTVIDLRRHRG